MKKILWLCPLMLLMMAFIGCDDKEKDDDESLGGQFIRNHMGSRSKKVSVPHQFPGDDGELENHRYDDTYGILQYIIMDYKCEESLKTKYCAKLTAAGFVDEDGYGIYKKTTTEYKLAVSISYGGGTLALSLSAEPIQ